MFNVDELISTIEKYKLEEKNKKSVDISYFSPEKLEQLKKFDQKYLEKMTKEEIELCGGLPINLLKGKEGTNIYECIWFNYMPVYHGLEPRWEVNWDKFED